MSSTRQRVEAEGYRYSEEANSDKRSKGEERQVYDAFGSGNGNFKRLPEIQELFWHKSSKTTEIYTHVSNKDRTK